MAEHANQATHNMQGFGLVIAAAGIGYLAGMLLAPKSGREIRQHIGRRADQMRRGAKEQLDTMRQRLAGTTDQAADTAHMAVEEGREAAHRATTPKS